VTKRYKVHFSASAQADLERIYYYIAEENPDNAARFIYEIEEKATSLDLFPQRQPFIPENSFFGTDYRHLVFKKYRIIYRISENNIFILRIVHGATSVYRM
jgi:toxin ParE1/3/4